MLQSLCYCIEYIIVWKIGGLIKQGFFLNMISKFPEIPELQQTKFPNFSPTFLTMTVQRYLKTSNDEIRINADEIFVQHKTPDKLFLFFHHMNQLNSASFLRLTMKISKFSCFSMIAFKIIWFSWLSRLTSQREYLRAPD